MDFRILMNTSSHYHCVNFSNSYLQIFAAMAAYEYVYQIVVLQLNN